MPHGNHHILAPIGNEWPRVQGMGQSGPSFSMRSELHWWERKWHPWLGACWFPHWKGWPDLSKTPSGSDIHDSPKSWACSLKHDGETYSYRLCQTTLHLWTIVLALGADVCFPSFSMMSLFLLLWLQSTEDFTLTREPCSLDKRQNLRMTSLKKRKKNLQRLECYFWNFEMLFNESYEITRWFARICVALVWLRRLVEGHELCQGWQFASHSCAMERCHESQQARQGFISQGGLRVGMRAVKGMKSGEFTPALLCLFCGLVEDFSSQGCHPDGNKLALTWVYFEICLPLPVYLKWEAGPHIAHFKLERFLDAQWPLWSQPRVLPGDTVSGNAILTRHRSVVQGLIWTLCSWRK